MQIDLNTYAKSRVLSYLQISSVSGLKPKSKIGNFTNVHYFEQLLLVKNSQ